MKINLRFYQLDSQFGLYVQNNRQKKWINSLSKGGSSDIFIRLEKMQSAIAGRTDLNEIENSWQVFSSYLHKAALFFVL